MSQWQFWIDRGGTFTDIIAIDPNGAMHTHKLLSSSNQYEDAILTGIQQVMGEAYDPEQIEEVRIGTTLATNAFLEKKGEPTALITTLGFRDSLYIRQQNRPHLFELNIQRPPPLYGLVTDVWERINAAGEVLVPLNHPIVKLELLRIKQLGYTSLAVVLMHATKNPRHELEIEKIAKSMGFSHIALSHQVSSIPKLIPRGETTVADAYLTPVVNRYTDSLSDSLPHSRILYMQSHGGLCNQKEFTGPSALLSGPAGGTLAAAKFANDLGYKKVITFDMGGTSTDVALFDGSFALNYQLLFHGYELSLPFIDIHTIAAGGGSILKFDGQRFQVGPESAGASPGPMAYGNSGPLTITDANIFLGKIPVDSFPAIFGPDGKQPLNFAAVERAFQDLADNYGLAPEDVAQSFIDVAIETMTRAIKKISVEKGYDPKEFALCSFGGAGGQMVCALAENLDMKSILIHPYSSLFSALGMGSAERTVRKDTHIHRNTNAIDDTTIRESISKLKNEIIEPHDALSFKTYFTLCVSGSDHLIELTAPDLNTAKSRFFEEHQNVFGQISSGASLELASLAIVGKQVNKHSWPKLSPAEDIWKSATNIQSPSDFEIWLGPNTSVVILQGWQTDFEPSGALVLTQKRGTSGPPNYSKHAALEVFYQKMQFIAEDMGFVLQRLSHSVNIKERLDFSCAVFTASGELLANAPHIPVHLGSMSESITSLIKTYGSKIREGQTYIGNSPLQGGTHLPDITVITPLFEDGNIVFFLASRGHHADIGGIAPGSMPCHSTTLSEEGIIIELTTIVEDNAFLESKLLQLLKDSPHPSRNTVANVNDIRAQVAANKRGCEHLDELIKSHGIEKLNQLSESLLHYSSVKAKEALQALPDINSQTLVESERKLNFALTRKTDNKFVFDFTGTSPCDPTNFNAPRAVVKAAVLYVIRCLIDDNIPLNDGIFRNVKLILPEQSLVNPDPDCAVVAGNVETSQLIVDLLLSAFGKLAHSQGTMNNFSFGDASHQYYETIAGGSGGGPDFNGESAVQVHMTNSRLTDPEILEQRFPVKVLNMAVRHGSGGKGRQQGGNGVYRRVEFTKPFVVNLLTQRRTTSPKGVFGGLPGLPGLQWLDCRDGSQKSLPSVCEVNVQPGTALTIETPGGGGYGESVPEDEHHLVFAYGSNLDTLQFRLRCPSFKIIGRARLADHELAFTRYSISRRGGVADIRHRPGQWVWGLVYSITSADLKELDKIEGHPDAYLRKSITVKLDDEKDLCVWVYDVNDKEPFIPPTIEYWWHFYKGAWQINAPTSYLKRLKDLSPITDA